MLQAHKLQSNYKDSVWAICRQVRFRVETEKFRSSGCTLASESLVAGAMLWASILTCFWFSDAYDNANQIVRNTQLGSPIL